MNGSAGGVGQGGTTGTTGTTGTAGTAGTTGGVQALAPFAPGPLINRVGRDNWRDRTIVGLLPDGTFSPDMDIPFRQGSFDFGVPEFVYRALLRADSKGRYFNEIVRDGYEYEEVE